MKSKNGHDDESRKEAAKAFLLEVLALQSEMQSNGLDIGAFDFDISDVAEFLQSTDTSVPSS